MRLSAAILGALVTAGCASPAPATGTPPAERSEPGPGTSPATTAATETWRRIADIPTRRSEVAAAAFRNAIYVVGGFGGLNVVERYVPGEARWEEVPDLPIGVDHPMAAAIDNGPHAGIYAIGGNSGGRPSARVFHLGPDARTWREVASMPRARSAGAAVAYEPRGQEPITPATRIWVVGGVSDAGLDAVTYEYDPAQDHWTERAAIPTPRDHLAAAHLQGKVCAVGGRTLSMSRNLASLECFDPAANTWERLPAAPTARGGVGAAVVGNRLFFIGGEQPSGTFREVEIYDAAARAWSRGPDLPEGKHGIGVAALGGAVYVLTGGPTPGGSQTATSHVLELR